MKKVNFDNYTSDYNRLLRQQTEFFASDEAYFARYKVGIVRDRTVNEPRRVLEFGCGIGRNIPFLREAFPSAEIMGSDVSNRSLELARTNNPEVFFWKEGSTSGERKAFDLIFVAGVFHHIPPDERLMVARLLLSRLAPEGLVFVFEHNPFNPVTQRIVSNCPYDKGVKLIRPAELCGLLRKEGGEVQGKGFTLFFPPKFKALLPLERYMSWLPLGGQYWVMTCRS